MFLEEEDVEKLGKRPCEDRGTDWSSTAMMQGAAGGTRSCKRQERVLSLSFYREHGPPDPLNADFGPLGLCESDFISSRATLQEAVTGVPRDF